MSSAERFASGFLSYLKSRGTTDTGSPRRSESVPRQVAMLCAHEAGVSFQKIGQAFGRDQMTAHRGVKVARNNLNGGKHQREALRALAAIKGMSR